MTIPHQIVDQQQQRLLVVLGVRIRHFAQQMHNGHHDVCVFVREQRQHGADPVNVY